MSEPVGVCVRVAALRPEYASLEAFLANKRNVLVCRRGRIWIHAPDGTKRLFMWTGSPFANPFRVGKRPGDHTLAESLALYRQHLDRILRDPEVRRAFRELATKARIGCFCPAGTPCHRDIIIERLRAPL